ncbi:MAG: AsmA family protein [Gammaproteobacteria bacterium]|nr:AsmA family protein [Gammaproteobacteria bacterium]MBU2057861.1 AsmA family protein [Gammaproteobacteria bacterium]MBU2176704.1 AsmA family protein [Gammaproteobacteria bacterium]MBU2247837.1 AsmA family protein [Gammaproteobacteria bacterium]MBU2346010.1 AsmA family protein [Gammaproteobacteria bacterium]
MNWLKWLLAAVVGLIAVTVFYLLVIFDLNDFKAEITQKVEQQTGRQLQIAGDIGWTVYPSLGVSLSDVTLSNPEGFVPEQMLEVSTLVAAVALMPLLNKDLQIQQLHLDGVTVNLVTAKNGKTSMDGLTSDKAAASDQPETTAPGSQQLQLEDVSIRNLQLNRITEGSPTQSLTLKSFNLTDFKASEWAPLDFELLVKSDPTQLEVKGSAQLQLSNNNQLVQLKDFVLDTEFQGLPLKQLVLETDLKLALDKKQLDWQWQKLELDDIKGSGQLAVNYAKQAVIKLDLKLDEVDTAAYMAENTTTAETEAAASTEPDLAALRQFDLDLKLAVKTLKAAGLHTENLQLVLTNKAGLVQIQNASADLYDGKVVAKATLDARKTPVSYSFNKQLSGLALRPMLIDGADIDLLSGTAKLSIEGKGHSLLPEQLKKNLLANGRFEITDGSLYGVNIAQMIRNAKATLKNEAQSTDNTEQKTDFSSLTGNFHLTDGVLTNPDLKMAAPLLRLAGKGSANLLTEALDYQLSTALVNTSKGQGGKEKDDLAGVEIPLKISGTMQEPKYSLDTKALFETQLKDKVETQKDKLKNKLLEKLGGL